VQGRSQGWATLSPRQDLGRQLDKITWGKWRRRSQRRKEKRESKVSETRGGKCRPPQAEQEKLQDDETP
jgi:hypothetical protein